MNQGKLDIVKQEMARVNIDILGISELKWTRMDNFNSDDHYVYYYGHELWGASSAPGKGHEEGGLTYAKAGSSLRSPPGNSRASTPKPESAYFLLCALTYTSDFTGAVPHDLSLKKELAYSSS